ncbi:MAG: ABC transporter ATP-binding protein [Planctomycetaceae bacterium]
MADGSAADHPASHELVIDVSDVTIRFGKFTAVERVSLQVSKGSVFGLLGPNGSGKTTLIRGMCGLIPFAEGSARVLGFDVKSSAERVRAKIGYMSQKFSLYEDLTARENMDFYAGIYGLSPAAARQRKADLVEQLGVGPYLDRRAGRLSGGWKQRLALACALLHQPDLVFLDEPTAGIDPVARRDLWDLLFRLAAEGITLFVTTHYMDEAERCSRVGYIYLAHLLACGTPSELKQLPGVTPPGTRRLEIRDPEPAQLLDRLRAVPGVRQATVFGQSVFALVDADRSEADLGLTGLDVRPAVATLEDVFVMLSRSQTNNGNGGS